MSTQNEIKRVVELPVSVERAWQAIATPAGMSGWFSESVEFDQKAGAVIKFKWDEYGTKLGRVERIEAPHRFAFRWYAGEHETSTEMNASNSTVVEMELTPVEGGTRLTVTESGFAGLAPELQSAEYAENSSGWDVELRELVEHLSEKAA